VFPTPFVNCNPRSFTLRLTRLSTLSLALTLGGWIATTTEASPISQPIDYASTGFIGGGAGPITFTGITGSFLTPGVIGLGNLQVGALAPDVTKVFNDTTFTIDVGFPTGPGGAHPWGHVAITGKLNGLITGSGYSDVVATFTTVSQDGSVPLPFTLSNFQTIGPVHVVPNGINGGTTSLYAYIGPNLAGQEITVPEPSSLAIFGVALAGLGWARRNRKALLSS